MLMILTLNVPTLSKMNTLYALIISNSFKTIKSTIFEAYKYDLLELDSIKLKNDFFFKHVHCDKLNNGTTGTYLHFRVISIGHNHIHLKLRNERKSLELL